MMGTVWLRLGSDEKAIQSYVNAIVILGSMTTYV